MFKPIWYRLETIKMALYKVKRTKIIFCSRKITSTILCLLEIEINVRKSETLPYYIIIILIKTSLYLLHVGL